MTQAEWLSSSDPAAMLRFLNTPQSIDGRPWSKWFPSDRKLGLFAVACCRLANYAKEEDISLWENHGFPGDGGIRRTSTIEWAVSWAGDEGRSVSREKRAALLRDIFGNPWKPVTLHRRKWKDFARLPGEEYVETWTNLTILSIAQTIYDERSFDRMPVLADSLEEVGCHEEELLRHLREDRGHVRGCWVLDLLLSKV